MDRFLVALRTKDIAIFLSCFSKKRPFSLTSTARAKPLRSRFTYAQLAEGLRPEGDFVGVMFGDDNLDSIRDYATGANDDGPWLPISSTKFAPSLFMPESNNAARIWVTWTKEGERWVIAEIAFPHE